MEDVLSLPLLLAGSLAFFSRLQPFTPLHLPMLWYTRIVVAAALPKLLAKAPMQRLAVLSFAVYTEVVRASVVRAACRRVPAPFRHVVLSPPPAGSLHHGPHAAVGAG